ncbi:hypothetical protein VTN00DRAFT_10384 [Thermoascus crustaceus]|uniref:uncharacterized protein n=1 Tax=Thermoascus crustaceus TaxID=5088 RepID=UPI0037437AC8
MAAITISKGGQAASDSDRQQESYTQMAEHDLEAIGRNCQFEFCGQLDFLPFRCESCKGTFCLEHRTETAHKCTHAGEWARRRNAANNSNSTLSSSTSTSSQKPTVYNSNQCSHPSCKTLIDTLKDPGVHCQNCNRRYCLKHRLREEHDCSKLTPLGARPAGHGGGPAPKETLSAMFSRVRAWGKDKTSNLTTSTHKPRITTVSQLNNMKRTAKGDAKIPADKRLYLHVVGTSESQKAEPPSGDFFFDSRWKVGRVLDDAARKLSVENVNNRGGGEESRLRIFHVESGRFLEFSDVIGAEPVKQGHTIVLMRGAGVLMGQS